MAKEIERKFLVKGDEWRDQCGAAVQTRQGYLAIESNCTVRVRQQEERAFLTIKGEPDGMTRLEFEFPIPAADAGELLERLCLQPCIDKLRYEVRYAGKKWEVDEFLGENQGLLVAEIELESEEEGVELPPWVGEEVTGDPSYGNASLARHPFSRWGGQK